MCVPSPAPGGSPREQSASVNRHVRPADLPSFSRHLGIDYSGTQTPTSSLPGLRVYAADRRSPPAEVLPPPSPRKYWTRRGVAEWLAERLAEEEPTLVGIDHGFSFPLAYFERHRLPHDWTAFLEDFQRHWPTDDDIYVDSGPRGSHAGRDRGLDPGSPIREAR